MHAQSFSHVRLFATPWTSASQAPLSMEFSRQEYWNGMPCPPPDLPDPGIEPTSLNAYLHWQAGSLPPVPPGRSSSCIVKWKWKSLLCPTLCDPIDCSPRSSSVHRILQARILEWVVIPFSRGFSQHRYQNQFSYIAIILWALLA